MKISYKGDYALKAMLDLALHYKKQWVTSQDFAERTDAPIKFLEQVLLELRKGGFIESRRGNIGGYQLAKPSSRITLGEVVRHIDDPIEPIACLKDNYSHCKNVHDCVFKKIWQKVYHATFKIIDSITFEELTLHVENQKKILDYSI